MPLNVKLTKLLKRQAGISWAAILKLDEFRQNGGGEKLSLKGDVCVQGKQELNPRKGFFFF